MPHSQCVRGVRYAVEMTNRNGGKGRHARRCPIRSRRFRSVLWFVAVLALSACADIEDVEPTDASASAPAETALPPNILLVIADDVGVDQISAYGVPDSANTPTIDGIAAQGVRFDHVWANPVCSSTRATILTGRYGFRTGVGFVAQLGQDLQLDEVTLAQLLARHPRSPYGTAAVGKWHLTSARDRVVNPDVLAVPVIAGFSLFRGVFKNIVGDYNHWTEVVSRERAPGAIEVDRRINTTYNTTAVVDHAAEWIRDFEAQNPGRPWFMWLGFNAAHAPFHRPPSHLHTRNLADPPVPCRNPPPFDNPENLRPCYQAMVEAMDSELGRLLENGISPATRERTVVIFVGDNGTVKGVWPDPTLRGRLKGTPYEGGIRVPLLIGGGGLSGSLPRVDDRLVNTTDLFTTILELAGLDVETEVPGVLTPSSDLPGAEELPLWLDSTSVMSALRPDAPTHATSPRSFAYAELFRLGTPDAEWPQARAIRDVDGFKLIRFTDPGPGYGREEFYSLAEDPTEQRNLLADELDEDLARRYAALTEQLDSIEATGWRPRGRPLPTFDSNGAVAD